MTEKIFIKINEIILKVYFKDSKFRSYNVEIVG